MITPMASAPECIERFTKDGIFTADPALTARRLREKAPGLWPLSTKGGGQHAPQVQPHHLTNFALAQAAHLPIDGAEAVAALRDLPLTKVTVLGNLAGQAAPVPAEFLTETLRGRLGEELDQLVTNAADPALRARAQELMGRLGWVLTLCADPPSATVSYRQDDAVVLEQYGDAPSNDRARRLVTLPYAVFALCGELWEDTKTKNAALPGGGAPDG
jgi:hypothetical protein